MSNPAADATLARQLVDSDLLSRIFSKLRGELVEKWAADETTADREDTHATYCAVLALEETLNDELERIQQRD